jgi:ATP-dependent RNA helicase DHX29
MAPNKKKKKAASNPSRGFSTVSVASKPKLDVTPAASAAAEEESQIITTPEKTLGPLNLISVKEEQTMRLQDLSRADLEAHPEDAELQDLIDKYGSMLKKKSSRIISRFATERRILRTQATRLSLNNWVSEEDVNHILELSQAQRSENDNVHEIASSYGLPIGQDEISMQLWELRMTLERLGFTETQVEATLIAMASQYTSKVSESVSSAKGSPSLLEEALDWLTGHSPAEDLPSYDQKVTLSTAQDGGDSTDSASQMGV